MAKGLLWTVWARLMLPLNGHLLTTASATSRGVNIRALLAASKQAEGNGAASLPDLPCRFYDDRDFSSSFATSLCDRQFGAAGLEAAVDETWLLIVTTYVEGGSDSYRLTNQRVPLGE